MSCQLRFKAFWLGAVVSFAVMASGQRGIAATPAALGSADTMEKVFRDEPWNRPPATRLTIEAARNEVEGIQLVVAAGNEKVRSATLEVTDLIGETGGTIPKSNVAWNIVGYVETEKPAYPVSKVGWWPDPLLAGGRVRRARGPGPTAVDQRARPHGFPAGAVPRDRYLAAG